jgi:hypothetical protein
MNVYLKYHTLFDWNDIYFIENKTADWNRISINELGLNPTKSIIPNYMMEPSVNLSK